MERESEKLEKKKTMLEDWRNIGIERERERERERE